MPYASLPPQAFWRRCRDEPDFRLDRLFAPKFALTPGMRVATAGSCFAQNIARYVRGSALTLVDAEPPPAQMPAEIATRHGYGLFSARYGNIYTARQLAQLLRDAEDDRVHDAGLWQRDGRWFDALRPNVEPQGLDSAETVAALRLDHLRRVRAMIDGTDVFVFTLGLTECWSDRATGLVFPTAPGVLAGAYDPDAHVFANLSFAEVHADLCDALGRLRRWNPALRVLLTVSPVPLTATASGQHVLRATTYSKSVLRAVAEEVAQADDVIDYFPSYEIITGSPFGARFFHDNLRTVTPDGVATVMATFFGAWPELGDLPRPRLATDPPATGAPGEEDNAVVCEEAMLDAYAGGPAP